MKTTRKQPSAARPFIKNPRMLKAVGREIRLWRKAGGLSPSSLGAMIGEAPAMIAKIESGSQPLEMEMFAALSQGVGASSERILLNAQLAMKNRTELQKQMTEVFRRMIDGWDDRLGRRKSA